MNINNDYKNRQIIPRWYPFNYACYMGEIEANNLGKIPKITSPGHSKLKEQEWLAYSELPFAIDFVGTALISHDLENKNALKASEYILSNKGKVSNLASEIAEQFVSGGKSFQEQNFNLSIERRQNLVAKKIAFLKKCVRSYPFNPIAWADLAFYYTIVDQIEKAEICIKMALNLSSENRFVLRAASRFFLHLEDPEQALFFLRKANLTWTDPWLLATEISIAETSGLKPKTIKAAKEILGSGQFSPRDLAELYGTMGTLEKNNGEAKKSKKMILSSMEEPNENTVAQAEWIAPQIGLTVKERPENINALFEANSRLFYRASEYKKSLDASLSWLHYQPFSSKPILHATYLAAVCLGDHEEAIRIIEEEAPKFLSHDLTLKNNYAFSLASLDKVEQAEQELSSVKITDSIGEREQAVICATKGLIEFRKGQHEQGRALYSQAIDSFRKLGEENALTLATYFLAREELRIKSSSAPLLKEKASKLALKLGMKELIQSEPNKKDPASRV